MRPKSCVHPTIHSTPAHPCPAGIPLQHGRGSYPVPDLWQAPRKPVQDSFPGRRHKFRLPGGRPGRGSGDRPPRPNDCKAENATGPGETTDPRQTQGIPGTTGYPHGMEPRSIECNLPPARRRRQSDGGKADPRDPRPAGSYPVGRYPGILSWGSPWRAFPSNFPSIPGAVPSSPWFDGGVDGGPSSIHSESISYAFPASTCTMGS